ncbi:preprotein translocase subunit SecG [Neptunitalea lumnitzerae]|uniref:Protein-export membrane protein SecG n=1 Tax=Neptunitalea lumnitzerae TaxID=2965509 RepID=A0ABQ5MEE5_9FLAO|nr:preprotein translocase subunit SecG [Neptunitalea sp. Y10]GLB47740.1 hypothetical protein Y10_01080 [Neptunitalea sp. Y10]
MDPYVIYLTGILLVSFLLIIVVMVQNPKGGGLSSTFGGGANQIGGVKKTGDFLEKSTWFLATVLVALILLANTTLGGSSTDAKILQGTEQQDNLPADGGLPADTPATTPTDNAQ